MLSQPLSRQILSHVPKHPRSARPLPHSRVVPQERAAPAPSGRGVTGGSAGSHRTDHPYRRTGMPPIWTDGDPSASPDVNASELMQNLIMNDDDKEWYEELFKKNHKSFLKPRFSVQPGGNACLSCSFIRVSNAVLAENGADHRVDTYGVFIPVPPSVVRGLEAAYPPVVRNQSHDHSPLHVTVLYVGQLDDLQAQAMRNACLDVLDHIQPFDVSVQGTSHFDNAGSSVFHACVVSPALENLHHTLKAALQTAGIPVEHRYGDNQCGSFKGHITLAMLPPGQHEKELPLCGSWVVDRVEVWNMGSPVSMRHRKRDVS